MHLRRATAPIALGAAVLLAAGCTGAGDDEPTESPKPAESPTATDVLVVDADAIEDAGWSCTSSQVPLDEASALPALSCAQADDDAFAVLTVIDGDAGITAWQIAIEPLDPDIEITDATAHDYLAEVWSLLTTDDIDDVLDNLSASHQADDLRYRHAAQASPDSPWILTGIRPDSDFDEPVLSKIPASPTDATLDADAAVATIETHDRTCFTGESNLTPEDSYALCGGIRLEFHLGVLTRLSASMTNTKLSVDAQIATLSEMLTSAGSGDLAKLGGELPDLLTTGSTRVEAYGDLLLVIDPVHDDEAALDGENFTIVVDF